MVTTPELPTMTRRYTISPLVVAWAFVLISLASIFIWLSFSGEEMPHDELSVAADHKGEESHDVASDDTQNGPVTSLQVVEAAPAPAGPAHLSLTPAPISGLALDGANGPLPVLGPDGLVSWKSYARPFDDTQSTAPRIAIIVTDIGLNSKNSTRAIEELPGEIDLAFSAYGRDLQSWMDKARKYGHEGFLMLPMEPLNFPDNDPGPHTLLSTYSPRDNLKRLDWLLSRVTGYVGVINDMGSKFTASEEALSPVLNDLNKRGLMMVDARSTRYSMAARIARRIGMPRALNNRYLDNVVSREEIALRLRELESTARTYGTALGIARNYPLSIEELKIWAEGLSARGFQLVPVTAVANRQPVK